MTEQRPPAPPGWYEWAGMKDTVRYWDGSGWTDHYGPSPEPTLPTPASKPRVSSITAPVEQTRSGRSCGYCGEDVAAQATRCPHCSGVFMHCSRCKALREVRERQKFVGIARGGRATVHNCRECGKQLTGPRM